MKRLWNILKIELGIGWLIFIGIATIALFCFYLFEGATVPLAIFGVLFSIAFTWVISIAIALFIKYKILKRSIKKFPALIISAVMCIIHVLLAELLNPGSNHSALFIVATCVYHILNRNVNEIAPLSSQATNSIQCPSCGLICPINTLVCDCGYKFQSEQTVNEISAPIEKKEKVFTTATSVASTTTTASAADAKPTLDIDSLLNANETERAEIQRNYEIELSNYIHHKNNQNKRRTNSMSGTTSKIPTMLKVISFLAVVGVVSWLCVYAYQCNNYLNSLKANITDIRGELSKQSADISKLDNEIDNLESDYEQLSDDVKRSKNSNTKASGTKRDIIAETMRELADDTSINTSSKNSIIDKKYCTFPNCDNSVSGNDPYCFNHSCLEPFCLNPVTDALSRYCLEHKCMHPKCHSSKALNSNYCHAHKN